MFPRKRKKAVVSFDEQPNKKDKDSRHAAEPPPGAAKEALYDTQLIHDITPPPPTMKI